MRVAVITPYFDEPDEWLADCHASVKQQTHPAMHVLVADGSPKQWVSSLDAQHIVLPVSHRDYGDTPRAIGSLSAVAQGFDVIAYLDADNWYRDDHVASLVDLHWRTGAAICTSMRALHRLDGSLLGLCRNSNGFTYSDTSCMMITRGAFHLASHWVLMPQWAHPIGDRVIWHRIVGESISTENSGNASVAYRTSYHGHYEAVGETPPPELGAPVFEVERALDRWMAEGNPSLRFAVEVDPAEGENMARKPEMTVG